MSTSPRIKICCRHERCSERCPSTHQRGMTFEEQRHREEREAPVFSDMRAEKRKQFDLMMSEKLQQMKEMQDQLVRQKEEKENLAMKQLRRKSIEEGGLVFKAKPVLKKDPFPTSRPGKGKGKTSSRDVEKSDLEKTVASAVNAI
jgi:hypothetical protein